ncbi:protein ORF19B [Goose adenovirus 4]|uniref:Protein ORF19B n=1 Tax=Goose adenovirus 4 TaxID=1193422 RepID=I3PMP6_9ADEN|nr:protein ORF19B [Goose adenovirus 4]AFC40590.1 protein ORF19B [Goose adenovirus 4]
MKSLLVLTLLSLFTQSSSLETGDFCINGTTEKSQLFFYNECFNCSDEIVSNVVELTFVNKSRWKDISIFIDKTENPNTAKLMRLYRTATNDSRILVLMIPGSSVSVVDFKPFKEKMPSINVECIGIGQESVQICNDICTYLTKSISRCMRILGIGGDAGGKSLFGNYNVLIIDDYQNDVNVSSGTEVIYVSMFTKCLPFYEYEEECVYGRCEKFVLSTEACDIDSLILFTARYMISGAILVDSEGRISQWSMVTYGYDTMVVEKLKPLEWFHLRTVSNVFSNGSSVDMLNANRIGVSIMPNKTKFMFDDSNSVLWIRSKSRVYAESFKSSEKGINITGMHCQMYDYCEKCGLCFNIKCDKRWELNLKSFRYHYGMSRNVCAEKRIIQDVVVRSKINVTSSLNRVDLKLAGMRPLQIFLETMNGKAYEHSIIAANWSVCREGIIELGNDSSVLVNTSFANHIALRMVYVGFDAVFNISVLISRVKREIISHTYHPEYMNNPVKYSWWFGVPLVGNRYTLYSSYRRRTGFYEFEDREGVFTRMQSAGVFSGGRIRDLILLVHGWHAFQSSTGIFKQLTRQHQKMTPNATVLFVDWESQGANDKELGNAAWSAVRTNLYNLLHEIPLSMNVHCIGHSLGGHACGGICRQYRDLKNKNCTRIVSLDPASVQFKYDSPDQEGIAKRRINRHDADYVAVLLTNRNFMGLHDLVGDEYITTNAFNGEKDGYSHEGCPTIGKWWGRVCTNSYYGYSWCEDYDVGTMFNSYLIPHVSDSCSHMMAPIQFAKFLDVWSPASIERTARSDSFMSSSWSGYVTSMDKRYSYEDKTIWYSFKVDSDEIYPRDVVTLVLKKHDRTPIGSHIFPEFCKLYKNVKRCVYFIMGDRVRKSQPFRFDVGMERTLPLISRIRRSDGIIPFRWKDDVLKSGDFWETVQSTEVIVKCNYGGWCTQLEERKMIPSSRRMLGVHGHLYPLDRCVFNDSRDFSDLKVTERTTNPMKRCYIDSVCHFDISEILPEWSQNEVMVIKMWDWYIERWVMPYYYGVKCSNIETVSVVNLSENGVSLIFRTASEHTMHFVYNFDKVIVKVKVVGTNIQTAATWRSINAGFKLPKSTTTTTTTPTTTSTSSTTTTIITTTSSTSSHPTSFSTSTSSSTSSEAFTSTSTASMTSSHVESNEIVKPTSDVKSAFNESKEEISNEIHEMMVGDEQEESSVVATINSNTSVGIVVGIIGMVLVAAIVIAFIKYRKPKKQVNVIVRSKEGSRDELSILNGFEDSSI